MTYGQFLYPVTSLSGKHIVSISIKIIIDCENANLEYPLFPCEPSSFNAILELPGSGKSRDLPFFESIDSEY